MSPPAQLPTGAPRGVNVCGIENCGRLSGLCLTIGADLFLPICTPHFDDLLGLTVRLYRRRPVCEVPTTEKMLESSEKKTLLANVIARGGCRAVA